MFCIHSDVLGITLSIDDNNNASLLDNDDLIDGWFISNEGLYHNNIRAALHASGDIVIQSPKAPQTTFWLKHQRHPRWHRILTKKQFITFVKEIVEKYQIFISDDKNSYFLGKFQQQQRLLDMMKPAKINKDSEHIDAITDIKIDNNCFASIIRYDNWSSTTGRMTVLSGPKILTMQRDRRSVFKSRYTDGVLIEIDFNALDARTLLAIAGIDAPATDLYAFIADKCQLQCDRSIIKEAVLAAMYGMSIKNFTARYESFPDAIDVLQSVKDFFNVKEIERKINSLSSMQNHFGRPLPNASKILSHYVQSTAVDVVCQGFLKIIDQIDEPYPIFLIHDALVLDVKKSYVPQLKKIVERGIIIDGFESIFPLKCKEFLDEQR